MPKNLTLLIVLVVGLLVGCMQNDPEAQSNYEGVGDTWRAELEYEEERLDDGQMSSEFDLVISYNDDLGSFEFVDELFFRLEIGNVGVHEQTETYDETYDETFEVSALYITGSYVGEEALDPDAEVTLLVEWDGNQEEFQLNVVE